MRTLHWIQASVIITMRVYINTFVIQFLDLFTQMMLWILHILSQKNLQTMNQETINVE